MTNAAPLAGGGEDRAEVYRIQRMIEDTHRIPGLTERLIDDIDAVMDEYGIPKDQQEILREGVPQKTHALGVHAVLCMQWSIIANAKIREHVVADADYVRQMEEF